MCMGLGVKVSFKKKIRPAHENWSAIFDRISARIGTISRVPSTGPTTQTCSVNNFFLTSAFLNLNSSCESRDQELQNDPFSIFMIGASSMVKISSQNGPHGQDLPFRCARGRGGGQNPDFWPSYAILRRDFHHARGSNHEN